MHYNYNIHNTMYVINNIVYIPTIPIQYMLYVWFKKENIIKRNMWVFIDVNENIIVNSMIKSRKKY